MPERRRNIVRPFLWIALGLVSISELAILQWLRLMQDRPLGWLDAFGILAGIFVLNATWLLVTRSSPRIRRSWLLGRLYLMASVGALGCGLLLAATWGGVGLLSAFTA